MGAAAAVIMRRQRDIEETFQGARATDVQTARVPGDLGVEEDRIFRGLVTRAVIRPTSDGRYYLDEPSWQALRRMRHRAALIMLFVVLMFFFIVYFTRQ